MFWRITDTVRLARPIACGSLSRLSPISAMSAVSTATAEPAAPMATPMLAVASAGASFTPSPTIATTWPSRCSFATASSLSSGSSEAWTSSMPTVLATDSATRRVSPVSITTFLTPAACRRATISAASSRSWSATAITPITCWSTATIIGVLPAAASSCATPLAPTLSLTPY